MGGIPLKAGIQQIWSILMWLFSWIIQLSHKQTFYSFHTNSLWITELDDRLRCYIWDSLSTWFMPDTGGISKEPCPTQVWAVAFRSWWPPHKPWARMVSITMRFSKLPWARRDSIAPLTCWSVWSPSSTKMTSKDGNDHACKPPILVQTQMLSHRKGAPRLNTFRGFIPPLSLPGFPKPGYASTYPDTNTHLNIRCQSQTVFVFLCHISFNKQKPSFSTALFVHRVLSSTQGSWPIVQAPQPYRPFILLIEIAAVLYNSEDILSSSHLANLSFAYQIGHTHCVILTWQNLLWNSSFRHILPWISAYKVNMYKMHILAVHFLKEHQIHPF